MTQSEESRRLLPPVIIMEKESYLFVVDKFKDRIGIGMGKPVESSPFMVGGYSFSIQLYTDGANEETHRLRCISLYIKNESPKAAQLVYDLLILDPTGVYHYGHSSFGGKNKYHQVYTCLPGSLLGYLNFTDHSCIRPYYRPNGSILIRATVGVVHDHDHQQLPLAKPSIPSSSFERHCCIVFQVGDLRFIEKESIITTRCPALISDYPQSNNTVVISDVDPDVFKGVLWYLNKKMINIQEDVKAMMNSDGLFALKMLAAADKLHLKLLRYLILECLVISGNFHVIDRYSEINQSVKELRRKVSNGLPQKIKDE
ncbi:hypothetical protein OROMI_026160 [Orobanche minor]